ncbi:hypothetical protein OHS59_38390 [Streptomyces sp. NBC_00414]|uniref:hypothetical protein n=1 Tax=Streptomyces sp. NBC_00414 TaxID=2975739 RepID=UPI002E2113E8
MKFRALIAASAMVMGGVTAIAVPAHMNEVNQRGEAGMNEPDQNDLTDARTAGGGGHEDPAPIG